jgi:molecular chaperone DnaK
VIEGLPVNPTGDAEYLVRHFLRLSRYEEALVHFHRLPSTLTSQQAELGLELLAKCRNREGYAEFLNKHAELFGIERPDFIRLNRAVRLYARSVVWIQHNAEEILIFGSGFFIGPRFIATNRHVITSERTGSPVPPESIRVVTKEGVLRVSAIHVLSSGPDDVAILELTEEEAAAKPLRLAFSELVEVGERIITLGFPSPDLSGFEENLYCNTGLVNRIRQSELCSERVLEISIELQGGISGAPILNEMGEVIGLVTYSVQRQQTIEGGYLQIERSFYAIPVGILRRLCEEIKNL